MFTQSLSILMLFLILSHGIYQQFIFKILKTKYQKESLERIEKGIDEKELVMFRFSKKDLTNGIAKIYWIEENEFRFQKEMYDIVKKEIKEDSVFFYCYHDEKESDLYIVMEKIFKGLFTEKPDKHNSLINYLSLFYSKPSENQYNVHLYEDGNSDQNLPSVLLEGEHFLIYPPPRS